MAIEVFRNHIIEAGVLDPEGVHHEFKSGMHGRKLDFDIIPTGSDIYNEWVDVTVDYLEITYPILPEILLGVANGTNRLALDLARRLDGRVLGMVSEKEAKNRNVLHLSKLAASVIGACKPELVLVLEDVGTTGSSSVQVAEQALEHGAIDVCILITWQRREQLEKLDKENIAYQAIIVEPLTTFEPEECQTSEQGFCHQGWQLIPRP